jgi:hypothetical protein
MHVKPYVLFHASTCLQSNSCMPRSTTALPRRHTPGLLHAPVTDDRWQDWLLGLGDHFDVLKLLLNQLADGLCLALQHVEGLLSTGTQSVSENSIGMPRGEQQVANGTASMFWGYSKPALT